MAETIEANNSACWCDRLHAAGALMDAKCPACVGRELLAIRAQLATVTQERERLKAALLGLVGASDPAELLAMEAVIRAAPAPMSDKAAILDAIEALRGLCSTPASAPREEQKPS